MLLEESCSTAHKPLLDDLADGALPGLREGIERVQRDERWHVGFGLRCFIETQPSQDLIDELAVRAEAAAAAWGDAVLAATRELAEVHVLAPAARLRTCGDARAGVVQGRAQGTDARRLHGPQTPAAAARVDRTPTISAPVARTTEILSAQGAGQRHLQTRVVGVGHQRRQLVGREPVQETATVLDRRVEQAGRRRPPPPRRGSSSGASARAPRAGHRRRRRHQHGCPARSSYSVADRAQQGDRL